MHDKIHNLLIIIDLAGIKVNVSFPDCFWKRANQIKTRIVFTSIYVSVHLPAENCQKLRFFCANIRANVMTNEPARLHHIHMCITQFAKGGR